MTDYDEREALAAKALRWLIKGGDMLWEEVPEAEKEKYRRRARLAIAAFCAGAPRVEVASAKMDGYPPVCPGDCAKCGFSVFVPYAMQFDGFYECPLDSCPGPGVKVLVPTREEG